jgi:hypothetical protein
MKRFLLLLLLTSPAAAADALLISDTSPSSSAAPQPQCGPSGCRIDPPGKSPRRVRLPVGNGTPGPRRNVPARQFRAARVNWLGSFRGGSA